MSLPTDSTGLPILPHEDGIGLLFSGPRGHESPCFPYHMARMMADYYASKYPEMRGEVVEYVKQINRAYLKHLLRRRVQKKVGFIAYCRMTASALDNLPKAERRSWERAQKEFQPWRDWP